ncbi:MAG: GNAT family N-acetyltransferase [candidate division WOR-3 bacterium]|nr:MAG: GNAT family N-acetyltransferase [candidate division WOR-3 bacterium]
MATRKLTFSPVTRDLWDDFCSLFSQAGVQNGCWCMYWRIRRTEFQRQYGHVNKKAMKRLIVSGVIPGILAFHEGSAVGWCSVASREDFPVLDRSPVLKRIDKKPVWSITCFFISKNYRHGNMMRSLIQASVRYAKQQGAKIIEAYPIRPERIHDPRPEMYRGTVSIFSRVGFVIAAQRTRTRPIMRYYVDKKKATSENAVPKTSGTDVKKK